MLFRNKRDRRRDNSKSSTDALQTGVARSSKTGGFEVRQDLDMICDDSSVESDVPLTSNRNVTIFAVNECQSLTKSSAASLSTIGSNHPTISPSASRSGNSRDDCSWARRDDERTSETSQRAQSREVKASSADSVATPQLQGCCTIDHPSLPSLFRESKGPRQSAPIPSLLDKKFDFGTFCVIEQANPYLSPRQSQPPSPANNVTPSVNSSQRSKGPIDLDVDDGSCSSSIDSDLGGRINISDSKLMESDSPGSLRLTTDALNRHQRKALLTALKPQQEREPPPPGYDSWKSRRDEKQWYKEQHQARDEELFDETWKLQMQHRERAATGTTIVSSEESWNGRTRLASDSRKWSLGDLSKGSWSSFLLGEDFEEEESEQPTRAKPRFPSVCSQNVSSGSLSKSSMSSRRLLEGDGHNSRRSVKEPLDASNGSRQSTWASSSRDSRSRTAVRNSRSVPQHDTAVSRSKSKVCDADTTPAATKKQTIIPSLGLKSLFLAEEDVADLSLAPLNSMEDIVVPPSNAKAQQQKVGHNPMLGMLRILVPRHIVGTNGKKGTTELAAELLERERQRETQSKIARRRAELEEKERIQQLKTSELERQRKREAQALKERNERKRGEPQKSKKEKPERENDANLKKKFYPNDHHDETGQDVSTITTTTSSMAPCAVCRCGSRSHIAMPCMHYSFCEACVKQMRIKNIDRCPVCSTREVVFSRVLT
jgi:hypothetical protein